MRITQSPARRRGPAVCRTLCSLLAAFLAVPALLAAPPEAPRAETVFVNPPEAAVMRTEALEGLRPAEAEVELTVRYALNQFNGRTVCLRSYNGRLVGPTIRARPGDTLRVTLENRIVPGACGPGEGGAEESDLAPSAEDGHAHVGSGNVFDITNLHTHGLHISPKEPQDNVFLRIGPGESYRFQFEIPDDHPAGTFWYHAHVHGSTAVQVSSGMAGALIIDGGLDEVPEIRAAMEDGREKVWLFQQIAYDRTGRIESMDVFGPGSWPCPSDWPDCGRRTSVNGGDPPIVLMQPGEVQRWRLIHGGVRETINLAVRAGTDGPFQTLHEIAADGLAYGRMTAFDRIELQPGYRSDVLFQAPDTPGLYHVIDLGTSAALSLLAEKPETDKVLAYIVVTGPRLDMRLPSQASLAPFLAFPWITDEEVKGNGEQLVSFDIQSGRFLICGWTGDVDDCREFTSGQEPRRLELDKAQVWKLSSKLANHPFHIHVNPFMVEREEPDGQRRPIWKDTLFVRSAVHPPSDPLLIRSRYQTFDGSFVLHCHILDHEDEGMMEVVEVVDAP